MNKDYGEILLEAMSTLLEANTRASLEVKSSTEEETITKLSAADPLVNFLPNISYKTIDAVNVSALAPNAKEPPPLTNAISWEIAKHDTTDDLLAVNCLISTSREETDKVLTGSYGLVIGIASVDKVYATTFDSSMMFGNILNFKRMPQKLMISVPKDIEVKTVGVAYYNYTTDVTFRVDELSLSLGKDLSVVGPTLDPFIITCADSILRYTVTDRGEVIGNSSPNYQLEARYIGTDSNGNYFAITSADKLHEMPDVSVRWYRYIPEGVPNPDAWGGMNWLYQPQVMEGKELTGIDTFSFKCTEFNSTYQSEQYKAVLVGLDLDTGVQIELTSNVITINKEEIPTDGYINKMQVVLQDKTDGVYPFYEQDGYIKPNLLIEAAIERVAKCLYETKFFNDNDNDSSPEAEFLNQLESIDWVYSSWSINNINKFDQIKSVEFIDEAGYSHLKIFSWEGITRAELDQLCIFSYTIPAQFPQYAQPSKIECIISFKNGKKYNAFKNISLNQVGSNGTDYTIVTRLFNPYGEMVNAIVKDVANYSVLINVYDPEGKLVNLNPPSLGLKYKLTDGKYTSITQERVKDGTDNAPLPTNGWYLPALTKSDILEIEIILPAGNGDVSGENEAAVGRVLKLKELFPLPICDSNYAYSIYQGPSKVIYNSEGSKPNYNKLFLNLLPSVTGIAWSLNSELTDKSLNPEISLSDGKYGFTPISMFDAKMTEKPVRIEGKIGETVIWDQPLIIMQDKYFSKIINAWDGSLQINKEGNYVMASSYMAGGKDEENIFTGVIIGELGTINPPEAAPLAEGEEPPAFNYIPRNTSPTHSETGIFGYQKGTQSFGFRSDGTVFIGPSGSGRINFDGNGGVIYSSNFDGFKTDDKGQVSIEAGTQGTFLNLADGQLITSSGIFRGDLAVNNGDLAGWQLDWSGLYRVRAQEVDDNIVYYHAGLNSDTFVPTLLTNATFGYTIKYGAYYTTITGAPSNISSATTWRIPQFVDGVPVQELDGKPNWSNLPNLTDVYFDKDIERLRIGDNFFNGNKSIRKVYLPKNTYYVGADAFANTDSLEIYLEGNVGTNWAPGWQGNATVYYSSSDWVISDFSDIKFVNEEKDTKMIRFYAGTDDKAPTMEAWNNLGKNRSIFLVADTGETYISDLEVKNSNISDLQIKNKAVFGVPYGAPAWVATAGAFEMVNIMSGGALAPTENTIYTGTGITVPTDQTFTISADNIKFKDTSQVEISIQAKDGSGNKFTNTLSLNYYSVKTLQRLSELSSSQLDKLISFIDTL